MKIYLASNNPHKAAEFNALVQAAKLPVEILPATDIGGMPEVAEDTGTFHGNARKKARALLDKLPPGACALADDSGICVDALDGAPGVESAYYAGHPCDPKANLAKLAAAVDKLPPANRRAHFYCLLYLVRQGAADQTFEGRCHGHLITSPRGTRGFGYDPIFIPDNHEKTYAELTDSEKNQISHRALAFQNFARWLRAKPAAPAAPCRP